MTSTIVPPVDLAPGMPSRVVTISATDVTEGGQSLEGQMVRFALSDTLDVSSGGDVIAKTQAEVVLDSNGEGSIRLPVYTDAVKTWCGDPDWAVLVTATWGSQKAIRVPAGTSSIALSALPPVRPLRGREKQWAITGVSVSVTTSGTPTGSASFTGGVLEISLGIPSGNWDRGWLVSGTDLNALTTPGAYQSPLYSITQSLTNRPTGSAATNGPVAIEVLSAGTAPRIQRWTLAAAPDQPAQVLERRLSGSGEWSPWTRMNDISVDTMAAMYERLEYGRRIAPGMDLDAFRTMDHRGRWYIADTAEGAQIGGDKPFGDAPCTIDVVYLGTAAWQTALRAGFTYAEPVTRKWMPSQGAWTAWASAAGGSSGSGDQTAQRDMLIQTSRLRHGGRIGTDGKTVVGLSFDHGFANFRDYVLPELVRLGLPASVAVNTANLGSGENAGVGYADLQDWSISHGIELANHSVSHGDASGEAAIRAAILDSLGALHTNCPLVTVDAYIMPGVSGNGYDGFNSGMDPASWWEHVAGRTILQNHAVATSAMLGQALPMDGTPVQTMDRVGFDTVSWRNIVQDRIASLHGTGMGMQIFMHPSYIGDRIPAGAVVEMLEWLAAERDAGRVEVLTASGFAWADAGSDRRTDLAAGAVWASGETTIPLAPLREWARGSQWVLSADLAAEGTLSVQDDTGALTASVTAGPGTGRLCFTIPTNASTITVNAGGGASATVTPV